MLHKAKLQPVCSLVTADMLFGQGAKLCVTAISIYQNSASKKTYLNMATKNWSQAIAAILVLAEAHQNGFLDERTAKTTMNAILRNYGKHIASKRLCNLISLRASEAKQKEKKIREHAVPLKVIVDKILLFPLAEVAPTQENITNMVIELQDYLMEVLVLKDEDRLLTTYKLKEAMPTGWEWGDSALRRYKEVGIEVCRWE